MCFLLRGIYVLLLKLCFGGSQAFLFFFLPLASRVRRCKMFPSNQFNTSHSQLYFNGLWRLGSTMLCTKHWAGVQNAENCCICLLAGISRRKTRWDTYCIKHLFGMSCRQTESGSGLDDGRGREAHDHNTDVPLQHLTPKRTAKENEIITIIGGKAGAWRTQYGNNPHRPLLWQGWQTTVWRFQGFFFLRGRNACSQKPF